MPKNVGRDPCMLPFRSAAIAAMALRSGDEAAEVCAESAARAIAEALRTTLHEGVRTAAEK